MTVPDLKRDTVQLPRVLQRMRSLQNSCQQGLEYRKELLSQLQDIQRANHALQFALSRKEATNENKSETCAKESEISVLSANDSANHDSLQLCQKLISNNAKMRKVIPALCTNNLYQRIKAVTLTCVAKDELYEQMGILSSGDGQTQFEKPIYSRVRSGFDNTEMSEMNKNIIKLPPINIAHLQSEISPFQNFGFDMRFSNGDTYAFDNFGEGPHIIERNTFSKMRKSAPSTPRSKKRRKSIISMFDSSPLRDDRSVIESNFDEIQQSPSVTHSISDSNNKSQSIKNQKILKFDTSSIHWIKFTKLIRIITHTGFCDSIEKNKMRRITILTHTGFCDSIQLLSALSNRYFLPLPPNLSQKELWHWIDKCRQPIRFRVIATIKYWLKQHWKDDFADNLKLQQCMFEFCKDLKKEPKLSLFNFDDDGTVSHTMDPSKLAQQIVSMISKQQKLDLKSEQMKLKRQKSLSKETDTCTESGDSHYSNYNYTLLTTIRVEVLGHCITEMCLNVFMAIKPRELVNFRSKARAPNLFAMIAQHELFVAFVQESILNECDKQRRVSLLDVFVRISYSLSQNGNFHGSHAIYSAINMSSVHRLKQTFALLSKATLKKLETLKHLFNYCNGRMNLRNKIVEYLAQKCIPEISLLRKDLTFVEDGNEWTNLKMINFFKSQLLAKIIEQIKINQNNCNNAPPMEINPTAFDYIRTKIQKWKIVFESNGDNVVWENFRHLSRKLE